MRSVFLFRFLFLGLVVLTLYLTLNPAPPQLAFDRYGDKFEHTVGFIGLGLLAGTSFPRTSSLRILEHLSFFGAMIEVFQAIPAMHRDCDWHDWVADTTGVIIALAILAVLRKFTPFQKAARTHEHSA